MRPLLLAALLLALPLGGGTAAAADHEGLFDLAAGHSEVGDGDCDKANTYYADSWFLVFATPTSAGSTGAGVEYMCYRWDRHDGYKGGATFWRGWVHVGTVTTSAGWYAYDEPPKSHCQTILVTPVSGPHDLGCSLGRPPRMPYMPERDDDPRALLP